MASEELKEVALGEETSHQVPALSNASTVAYAPFDIRSSVHMEKHGNDIGNLQKNIRMLGFGTIPLQMPWKRINTKLPNSSVSQGATLQGVFPGSRVAHTHASTVANAELQGIDTAILELKNSLKVNDGASGSAPQEDLDICFLVDCTGSMGWCIEEVKSKVRSIIDQLHEAHKGNAISVAFVGYRDFKTQGFPDGKFEVHDFAGRDEISGLQEFLKTVTSLPNQDPCEDVAGGLLHVLDLSWKSPIRLVIHFCDDPCHGRKYHSAGSSILPELSDKWPDGDPRGNTIEDLMQQLCSRGISYYFAAITKRTDKMARIMQNCYAFNANVEFKIMAWKDARTSLAPTVIRSVNSSIQHSRSTSMSSSNFGGLSTRHYSPFRES